MMDEADWAELNEHLSEVMPIFDAFCMKHDFVYVDRHSIGRYPRIRIERGRRLNRWVELFMEYDQNGQCFERFRPDLPYELSAGASLVERHADGVFRFQHAFQGFANKPFHQVGAVLFSEIEKLLPALEPWNESYLKSHGRRIKLE